MIATHKIAAAPKGVAQMHGTTRSEQAMGSAIAAHLCRHGAIAAQIDCAAADECGAALDAIIAEIGERRLVLLTPEAFALPDRFAALTTLRIAVGPGQSFGTPGFAAALDRLAQIDGALLLVLFAAAAADLPPDLAPVAPAGRALGAWLAARLRNAACGGEGAG